VRRALAALQILAFVLGLGPSAGARLASGVAASESLAAPAAARELIAVRHHAPGAALVRAMRASGRNPGRVQTASVAQRRSVRAGAARRAAPRPTFHRKRPLPTALPGDPDVPA